jgi:FemAB-related protein (PEP-CTERM system-associated)
VNAGSASAQRVGLGASAPGDARCATTATHAAEPHASAATRPTVTPPSPSSGAAPCDPLPTVRELGPGDTARWNDFVLGCPDATFFHRAEWKGVVERAFGHRTWFLYAETGGAISGVLPLAQVKSRLFGHALVSLPFAVYGGIAAADPASVRALDERAQALAVELGVGHLEYRHVRGVHPDWKRSALYVTFRKPLLPDVEANLLAVPRKQRAMIRKGIKNGLGVEIDRGVERFFRLYSDNVQRHGTPALAVRYFRLLREAFGDDCEVLLATKDGRPVSGVLSFYFRDEVLPYYAGDLPEARDLAANDFKYWQVMRRACERGMRVFDYGRSKRGTGSFDFKRNWGFEAQPLEYEYRLVRADKVPENNPLNPKYRAFIWCWKRLPARVATALGPFVVRNLG